MDDTVRATPLQTLPKPRGTGMFEKGAEADIPRGEAVAWAAMKPPLVTLTKVKPAAATAKVK